VTEQRRTQRLARKNGKDALALSAERSDRHVNFTFGSHFVGLLPQDLFTKDTLFPNFREKPTLPYTYLSVYKLCIAPHNVTRYP
jgi:hypothetical protein